MKKPFFQEHPELIEFAKRVKLRDALEEETKQEVDMANEPKKKKQNVENHLKWGNPSFGIFERFQNDGSNKAWYY